MYGFREELPPVGGHVVGQDNDFSSLSTRCKNIQGKIVVSQ